ncbi:MAG: hypothetical protein AAB783_01210 [Patescibacteria group bacterium]
MAQEGVPPEKNDLGEEAERPDPILLGLPGKERLRQEMEAKRALEMVEGTGGADAVISKPWEATPENERIAQALKDAGDIKEPGESSDASSREVEDQFIKDFPDTEEAKRILEERKKVRVGPTELGDISDAFEDPKSEGWDLGAIKDESSEESKENRNSKESSVAGTALRFFGEKARGVYERLGDRARETVTRLYDRVKLENDSRSLLKSEEVFRAQAQFHGEPERQLQQITSAIAAEQQVIDGNAKTRAKLLETYPGLLDSELGKKLLEEDETAKRSMSEQQSQEPLAREKVLEVDESRVKFKAEQARQAASVIERIDAKMKPQEEMVQSFKIKGVELGREIESNQNICKVLREELDGVNKSADAYSPDSPEFKTYLRRSEELKKHLDIIDTLREGFKADLVKNNLKLENIQARMKPWGEKRKVYEGMVVSELSKEQIEKGQKSLAEAEAREKGKTADKGTKKEPVVEGAISEGNQREAWEKVKDGTREQVPAIEDHSKELRKFLNSSGLSPERQEVEYQRLLKLIEENKDKVLGVERQEEDRSRAELEQEYVKKGIPQEIAWGPESAAEKEALVPEDYAMIWNKTVKGFPIVSSQFSKMFEKKPSNSFELEELDEKCRNYFRESYRAQHGKRLDWRYHDALEEGIKKTHGALMKSFKYLMKN